MYSPSHLYVLHHNTLLRSELNMSITSMATQLSVRLDDELENELKRYCDQQKFDPSRSDVVRRALEEFLEREAEAGAYEPSPDFE